MDTTTVNSRSKRSQRVTVSYPTGNARKPGKTCYQLFYGQLLFWTFCYETSFLISSRSSQHDLPLERQPFTHSESLRQIFSSPYNLQANRKANNSRLSQLLCNHLKMYLLENIMRRNGSGDESVARRKYKLLCTIARSFYTWSISWWLAVHGGAIVRLVGFFLLLFLFCLSLVPDHFQNIVPSFLPT